MPEWLTSRGIKLPLLYSPRLRRGDWVLTLMVVTWLVAIGLVVAAWATGRDLPTEAASVLTLALVTASGAYVGKSLPERRVSATREGLVVEAPQSGAQS